MSKERLTEKTKDCFGYRLKDGSDAEVGFFKDYAAFYSHMMVVRALGEYEELEERGLLLRLPVRIGQTLYTNSRKQGWYFRLKDAPYRVQVEYIGINNSEEMVGGFFNVSYEKHDCMMQFNFSDIGKTVFLTQSEAEEKLKELERK